MAGVPNGIRRTSVAPDRAELRAIGEADAEQRAADSSPKCAIETPNVTRGDASPASSDPVEALLEVALRDALGRQDWAKARAYASELEQRTKARQSPAVVHLDAERAKRGRTR